MSWVDTGSTDAWPGDDEPSGQTTGTNGLWAVAGFASGGPPDSGRFEAYFIAGDNSAGHRVSLEAPTAGGENPEGTSDAEDPFGRASGARRPDGEPAASGDGPFEASTPAGRDGSDAAGYDAPGSTGAGRLETNRVETPGSSYDPIGADSDMLLRLAESTGGGVSDSGGATWDKSAIGVDSVGSVADADPRDSDESSVEPTISQTTGNRAMLIPIDTATVTTTATAAAILGMVFSPGWRATCHRVERIHHAARRASDRTAVGDEIGNDLNECVGWAKPSAD
ncbi:MAG: hypothetical protein NTW96_21485 [Planctomycetia bacterium]|nr:hypothetical protein [Planctomycetia bacterium]